MPLSYEEAIKPPEEQKPPQATPASLSYEEATAPPESPLGPMPGPVDALTAGMAAGLSQTEASIAALRGEQVHHPDEKPSPASAPLEWSDIEAPYGKLLPKIAYQFGESAPTLAGGIAGGAAGSVISPGVGTIVGGALGAGVGSAIQSIAPMFGEELRRSPGDPDGAWNRAIERAGASGVFSAAGWAAFGGGAALAPLKRIVFQAFGIQPAIATADQIAQNVMQGKAPTENLGRAYAQGVVGTAVPMIGHAALGKLTGSLNVVPDVPPVDEAKLRAAQDNIDAVAARMPQLNRDLQDAYSTHGPDSPEAAWASHMVLQNREAMHQANEEFKQVVTPPAPDPMLVEKIPIVGPKFRSAIDSFKRSFAPEFISNLAFDSEPLFREYNAKRASAKDSAYHEMDKLRYNFTARPDADNIEWIKSATGESLAPLPPDLAHLSPILHTIGDWVWKADHDVGSKVGYVKDYLPREFENPDAVASFFDRRNIPGTPPGWNPYFQRSRTFSFLQEALDAGFKLRTTNPVDLMTNRLLASADMRARVELLKNLSDYGAAREIENEGQKYNFEQSGWQLVKDPVGNEYALHPDVQPLWQNAVIAKGLWSAEGATGNAFRKWMALKNWYVPIKLSLSAFHLLHVGHIAMNDAFARGWQHAKAGDITGAARETARAFTGFFHFPEGQELRGAWLTPEWGRTPEQKALVKLATEGGFSPQLSEQLRSQGQRTFKEALAANNPFVYIPVGAWRGSNFLQRLLFEHWIPNLKSAAYVREAQSLFQRRPDLFYNDKTRRAALGTIAKSIDNRFGEMFYSNLFWNRTLKDIGIGSFLSLGWNLGFLREFGGGMLEPWTRRAIMTPTQEAVNAARSKTSFALFYIGTAMALNAAMTKAMTGDNPEGMDYFLPRFGGNNPDGSPRRLSNMYYTREVPMLKKHIDEQSGNPIAGLGEMLWNKMILEPAWELYNNRDYYGYNITDPSSPLYQRAYQMAKYFLSDQLSPITITGAKRALKDSGKWDDKNPLQSYTRVLTQPEGQLALLGFGPAPSYVSKSPAQNRIAFLFSHYVSPVERPLVERSIMEQRSDARKALQLAHNQGDEVGARAAAIRLAETGVATKGHRVMPGTADIYMFQRLPFSIQTQFLKEISPDDFKRYFPKSAKLTKANPEIRELVRQYYQR